MLGSTCTARFVAALLLLCIIAACNNPKRGNEEATTSRELGELLHDSRKYGIESAVITYSVSGNETGTEELAFDRFGMRQARTVHTKRKDDIDRHTLEIFSGTTFYRIELNDKWGLQTDRIELAHIRSLNRPITPEDWTNITLKLEGYKPTGTAQILGRECTVWKHPEKNVEHWMWKGVALRTVRMDPSRLVTKAVVIDEDPEIEDQKYEIPPGIRMEIPPM